MEMRHAVAVLLGSLLVADATAALAANAAPVAMEIGVATYGQVKTEIGKTTVLEDAGANKFTGGKMLSGRGKGLGIDGLKEITFIFDKADVLQGVLMTLAKDFKPAFEKLRKKYKLVSKKIPFVGDSEAKFSQGSSVIILDAPHLSFEMSLNYLSETLLASFKSRSALEKARHDQEQQDKL